MERADRLNVSERPAAEKGDNRYAGTNTVKEIFGTEEDAHRSAEGRRPSATVVISATLLVFTAAAAAYWVYRFEELRRTTIALQSTLNRVSAVVEETHALKNEIENLRQFLASTSSEDVLFLKIKVLKPSIDEDLARLIARNVHKYSTLYGRDPNLVLAIIAVESHFNPDAVSSVGATGLMQVMPQWKKVLGINGDLKDPEVSIRYGLQILGFYSEMYKDLEMTLTAYNRGPGPVDMALMRGKNPNNGYPNQVLLAYDRLKKLAVTVAK